MTRVLLTGAGGFVGHHTLEHILETTDWDVVCTDSFRHSGKTDRISEVLEGQYTKMNYDADEMAGATVFVPTPWSERVTVVTHDLTAPFSDQLADKIGPVNAIISMASESHVDRSITHPVPFIRNNVDLVLNLLEFQRTYAPNALFLQVSTDEVYGPAPDDHNHVEWEPHYPSNPYSASKSAQEAICFAYWRTYGTPMVLTNTMNIIGERQDPEKFVPLVIQKVIRKEVVSIHASPTGKPGSRFYLHARNQADALVYLLKVYMGMPYLEDEEAEFDADAVREAWQYEGESMMYSSGSLRPPKYHVVGELEVDNLKLAELIAKFANEQLHAELIDFHSSRPGHDRRYALDGSKMAQIGWKAPIPFEDSLKKTVEWTLEHPEWMK